MSETTRAQSWPEARGKRKPSAQRAKHGGHLIVCGPLRVHADGRFVGGGFFEDGKLELYDLKNDVGETKNLAATMPAKAKELHDKLLAWRKDVGAKMPTKNR